MGSSLPRQERSRGMSYLLRDAAGDVERLQLQSRVWEPAGQRLLTRLGDGTGRRVLDAGCGAMGWLRLLSRWVGPTGTVVGTDVNHHMLDAAATLCRDEALTNVELVQD